LCTERQAVSVVGLQAAFGAHRVEAVARRRPASADAVGAFIARRIEEGGETADF
jgi:hypothetical protein